MDIFHQRQVIRWLPTCTVNASPLQHIKHANNFTRYVFEKYLLTISEFAWWAEETTAKCHHANIHDILRLCKVHFCAWYSTGISGRRPEIWHQRLRSMLCSIPWCCECHQPASNCTFPVATAWVQNRLQPQTRAATSLLIFWRKTKSHLA